jgi:rRNA maturation RNase YbeY
MILIAGKHRKLKGLKNLCKEVVKQIITDHKKHSIELNIILVDDETLLEMNINYLQHDYYTDIITHDFSEGEEVNGELYISYERVKENAIILNIKSSIELRRVIAHGLLHLLGFKDKTKNDQLKMREAEEHALSLYK